MRALTLLALMVAAALSGCSSPSAPEALGGAPAGVDVRGQVVDEEARAVAEALVSFPELVRSTRTDGDGKFLVDGVPPGNYTLTVARDGYENLTRTVTVNARTAVLLSIELRAITKSHAGHWETFPFVGIQQCMWFSPSFKAGCSFPYVAAIGTLDGNGVNVTQYGVPRDVMTNQYRYNFSARSGHAGIVSELGWTANTDASRIYALELSCAWYDAAVDDCVAPGQTTWEPGNTYARARGVSPLRIEWTQEKTEWLPWIMSRAYLNGETVGMALDQRVEMYNTVFYGDPPPPDWRVLEPR